MPHIQLPESLIPADGRFGCGPSRVRPDQVAALAALNPTVLGTSHRQEPVKALVGDIRSGLAELFQLPVGYEILFGNGGATAFWDSASHSLIERRSQNLVFGEFSQKFASAAAAPFLAAPQIISAEPGSRSVARPEAGIDVYAWPQNETSTGVMAPVQRVHGDAGALTVIDATSAAGGIDVTAAEADVYYFSPQKNFGSDGGLWFAFFSPAAIDRVERIAASDRYIPEFLSLHNALTNSRLNQTLNTPAIASLALFNNQIQWMLGQGGLRWAAERTASSSNALYSWADAHEIATPFVSNPEHRSQVVVTIDFAQSVSAASIAAHLRANGIVDIEPYRKLGRNQLRVGTFTSVPPEDVAALIAAIDYVIERIA